MKLYADLPVRRTAQIVADTLVLLWVALWAWVGRLVHDATQRNAPDRHRGHAHCSTSDIKIIRAR